MIFVAYLVLLFKKKVFFFNSASSFPNFSFLPMFWMQYLYFTFIAIFLNIVLKFGLLFCHLPTFLERIVYLTLSPSFSLIFPVISMFWA